MGARMLAGPKAGATAKAALVLTTCLAAGALLPASASEYRPLTGIARDALGNVIEDVEVLILDELGGVTPLAVARTNREGTFLIQDLRPGTYRVAAIKRGYLTYLGEINTLLGASLEMLLRTGPGPLPDTDVAMPADADWLLRLPRRGLLREVDAQDLLRSAPDAPTPLLRSFYEVLELQLDQTFHMGGHERRAGASAARIEGRETEVNLAGAIGERGSIRLRGNRQRSAGVAPGYLADEHASGGLWVDVDYETGREGTLALTAFYNRTDSRLLSSASDRHLRQGHRAWGYDAAWSRQIDPISRVSVQLDYRGAVLDVPLGLVPDPTSGEPGFSSFSGEWLDRRVGAQGVYESVPAERHQVRVGFRAQFVELPVVPVRAVAAGAWERHAGPGGWSLRLNAEDSWTAAGPVTVVYGLGYRHSLAGDGASLLVPRLGGAWRHERFGARLLLSYPASANRDALWTSGDEARRGYGLLGYEAELELPLLDSLTLEGSLSYEPMRLEPFGYAGRGDAGQAPLFLSDGNAASRETAVTLTHETERTTTRVRLVGGAADGMLAALPGLATPVQLLADSRLAYRQGSLGVRVAPWGTHMVLEYRSLEESAREDLALRPVLGEESVELRLVQDLVRGRGVGFWRLLLALQAAELERGEAYGGRDPLASAELPPISDTHRLSAGVSVAF